MKPEQVRQYDPDNPLTHGVERGRLLFQKLEEVGIDVGEKILDIGCGYGGISIAHAMSGKTTLAIDLDPENLAVVRKRACAGEGNPGKVTAAQGSSLAIPLADAVVDSVLMIGVIEWIGYSDTTRKVWDVQLSALKEALRVLRPGGLLIIGTKNRLFPRYLWDDPQLRKPLLNVLPRGIAHWLSTHLYDYEYRAHVYSYWGWLKLLRQAGFYVHKVLVPIFTYQYPLILANAWDAPNVTREMAKSMQHLAGPVGSAAKNASLPFLRTVYYQVISFFHLLGIGAGGFLLIGRKPRLGE